MIAVNIDHVTVAYGDNEVLQDVSWAVHDNTRAGLIGANGSGKSTLFSILTGSLKPSDGGVNRGRSVVVGHLDQEVKVAPGQSALDYLRSGRADLLDAHEKLVVMEHEMAHASEDEMEKYGALRDWYESEGGYALESRCQSVMGGLGITSTGKDQSADTLSGGQRNRLALARLLVRKPTILLLDEPTNHLDIAATEWLEGFLSSYAGAFIVISHDRVFLDRTVKQIVEVEENHLFFYPGNYTSYAAEKAQRIMAQTRAYELQQKDIARQEDFIRKNIAGQKTKQAQGRRKQLARLERIEEVSTSRTVKLKFGSTRRGANEVINAKNLSKSYGDLNLFKGIDLAIRRGDRIGIVGPNGVGKTTLLKLLIDIEMSDSGEIKRGAGIELGYFGQQREDIDLKGTVLNEVWQVRPSATQEQIRTFLGNFLFTGEFVDRVIGTLSGGEQNRVALAKLILSEVNFLALDEPTNHLDMPSRVALENALKQFAGTILLVSHDRALLSAITNRIWAMEDGVFKVYEMGYTRYAELRKKSGVSGATLGGAESTGGAGKASRISDQAQRKDSQKHARRREQRMGKIEGDIQALEDRAKQLAVELELDEKEWQQLTEISQEHAKTQASVEALYREWAELEKVDTAI